MGNEANNHPQTSSCPHRETCPLAQDRQKLSALAERFKQAYCMGSHASCCRRWIWEFLGAEKVPELMLPHQRDWAQQILMDAGIGYAVLRQRFSNPDAVQNAT